MLRIENKLLTEFSSQLIRMHHSLLLLFLVAFSIFRDIWLIQFSSSYFRTAAKSFAGEKQKEDKTKSITKLNSPFFLFFLQFILIACQRERVKVKSIHPNSAIWWRYKEKQTTTTKAPYFYVTLYLSSLFILTCLTMSSSPLPLFSLSQRLKAFKKMKWLFYDWIILTHFPISSHGFNSRR